MFTVPRQVGFLQRGTDDIVSDLRQGRRFPDAIWENRPRLRDCLQARGDGSRLPKRLYTTKYFAAG